MSAFLQNDTHISAIVRYGVERQLTVYHPGAPAKITDPGTKWEHEWHCLSLTPETAQEAGQVLVNENYRSLNARYGDAGEPHVFQYIPRDCRDFGSLAILKACAGYDYQACETDNYDQTYAAAIVNAVRHRAIHSLPGWDAVDTWSIQPWEEAKHEARKRIKAQLRLVTA